jgi:uncharacterized protein
VDLCLVVDHACNLRCSYCYTGEKTRRPMPAAIGRRAIDLALARQPSHLDLSFFGGEPLLDLDLLQAIAAYALDRAGSATLRVVLNTNATLVDDRVVEWVRSSSNFAAIVSLDGPTTIHDRHRMDAAGRGTHARVHQGLRRLVAAGAHVTTVAVVTPESAAQLGDVVRELLAVGGERIVLAPNYRTEWTESAFEEFSVGMGRAADAWMDHLRDGGGQLFEPLAAKILSHLHGGSPCAARCQLAGKEFAVAPSGRIYPCGQLVNEDEDPTHVIGHVDRGLDHAALARLQNQKAQVARHCGACALQPRCDCQCGCNHVALTGAMGRITGALCELESRSVEAADRVGETLHAEGCAAFRTLFYERRWQPAAGAEFVRLRRSRDTD